MSIQIKVSSEDYRELTTKARDFIVCKYKRNYKIKGEVILKEYNESIKDYTGRTILKRINYILPNESKGIKEGFTILRFKK